MLKAFKIRDLHSPTVEEDVHEGASSAEESSPESRDVTAKEWEHANGRDAGEGVQSRPHHGVVQLSAPEYDEIVMTHPRAMLTYMDLDDGDMVTVGSSLELSQRLDDPIPTLPYSPSSPQRSPPPQDDFIPMHIFDIRRSNSVTELWKRFEQEPPLAVELPPQQDSSVHGNPTVWDSNMNAMVADPGTGGVTESEKTKSVFEESFTTNIRERWFRACNPPQTTMIQPSRSEQKEQMEFPVSPVSSTRTNNDSISYSNPDNNPFADGDVGSDQASGSTYITAEGRRQAQEAGARMRGWRGISDATSSSYIPLPSVQGDPWSSYKPQEVFMKGSLDTEPQKETAKITEPPTGDEAQPLLAAFEAEMSRIMEASGTLEDKGSQSNMSVPATDETPEIRQPAGPPKPVDILAHALQNLVGGVGLAGSELKSILPEIERQLSSAQKALPENFGPTFQGALSALDGQVKNLANALREASVASGQAADKVRQAELPAAEQAVDGLRTLAGEFSQMGRTLFEAFETEFGRHTSGTPREPSTENISSATQTETSVPGSDIADVAVDPATRVSASGTTGQELACDIGHFTNEKETLADAATGGHEEVLDKESSQILSHEKAPVFEQPRQGITHPYHPYTSHNEQQGPASHRTQTTFLPWQLPLIPPPFGRPNHFPPTWHGPPVPPPPPPPFRQAPFRPYHPVFYPNANMAQQPHSWSHSGAAPSGHPERSSRHQAISHTSRPENETLFIGNIGFNVTEKMIRDVFASKGFLVNVDLPVDLGTRKHAGFGYLHFPSIHSARAALDALQGVHIDGHSINLEFSDHSPINTVDTLPHIANNTTSSLSGSAGPPFRPLRTRPHSQHYDHRQLPRHIGEMASEQILPSNRQSDSRTGKYSTKQKRESGDGLNKQPESRNGTSMLDEADEDPEFSARYPSLLSGESVRAGTANDSPSGRLPTLSPEADMARFPPVSQLDAHMLTSNHRFSHTKPQVHAGMREIRQGQDVSAALPLVDTEDVQVTPSDARPVSLPGSFPQGTQEVSSRQDRLRRPVSMYDPGRQQSNANFLRRGADQLRRSNTVIAADPAARLTGPFNPLTPRHPYSPVMPLRRSATERHSLRARARENRRSLRQPRFAELEQDDTGSRLRDTWNDYPRAPGSFPIDDVAPTQEPGSDDVLGSVMRRSLIDSCVDTLFDLGYGGTRDGGRQRMTVYAEAADGRVSDAIEMIEEERKAYAQQGSLI